MRHACRRESERPARLAAPLVPDRDDAAPARQARRDAVSSAVVRARPAGDRRVHAVRSDALGRFPERRLQPAPRVRRLRGHARIRRVHRAPVRLRHVGAELPVPAARHGVVRGERDARGRSVSLASRERRVACGQCCADRAARVAARRQSHDPRALRGACRRMAVRLVRAGGRSGGVGRGALRRHGAALHADRRVRVRREPPLERRLRPSRVSRQRSSRS